jgi:tRNA1Val (adenine37-N6)-methyltransferase
VGEGELTLDSIRDISLYQPRDGYRFSVDSLLLFNFVNLQRVERIADLGAGSGIIGILLAKKYRGASVTLFEIQPLLADIARRNIDINSLANRITVINKDLREVSLILPSLGSSFDVVVSNPPFRKIKSGRIKSC